NTGGVCTRRGTRQPELPQSKALAYQDLLSAPRTRPPPQPTPSRRGPAVGGPIGLARLGRAQTASRPYFRPLHNPQARKADECSYEPTISKTSVPIRTRD